MRIARSLLIPAVMAGVLFAPGMASAHTVGTPGEPNCFGQRTSHANDPTHQGTPKERAALMQQMITNPPPFLPPEAVTELQAFFGPTVEVREIQRWVRINCSDDPIVAF